MKMVKITNSSNIAEIGYDEPSQVMRVRFHTGLLYQFEKVPVVLHVQLMNAHSKGQYFSKHVRNNQNFPCTLVNEKNIADPHFGPSGNVPIEPYLKKNVGYISEEKLKNHGSK